MLSQIVLTFFVEPLRLVVRSAHDHGNDNPETSIYRPNIMQYNVPINHEARQVTQEDFRKFDYILASDEANLRNLERMKPRNATATVKLFGSFDDNKPIGDPYYGGIVSLIVLFTQVPQYGTFEQSGFEQCYRQCVRYSNKFLDEVVGKEDSTTSNL